MQAYYYHSAVSRQNAVIAIYKKISLHYQKLDLLVALTITIIHAGLLLP